MPRFANLLNRISEAGGATDDDNFILQMHFERQFRKLHDMKDPATKAIDTTKDDDTGTWQHANSLGATDLVITFSIKYAQWSMAT